MTILDDLSPERFVVELPFLLESLAIEFPQIRIVIDPENLHLLSQDLETGLRDRAEQDGDELLPCLETLNARARDGEPVQILMTRDAAFRFAADVTRGTEIRLTDLRKQSPATAK